MLIRYRVKVLVIKPDSRLICVGPDPYPVKLVIRAIPPGSFDSCISHIHDFEFCTVVFKAAFSVYPDIVTELTPTDLLILFKPSPLPLSLICFFRDCRYRTRIVEILIGQLVIPDISNLVHREYSIRIRIFDQKVPDICQIPLDPVFGGQRPSACCQPAFGYLVDERLDHNAVDYVSTFLIIANNPYGRAVQQSHITVQSTLSTPPYNKPLFSGF